MNSDATIDAIREVRHRISASVHHDARKLVEHYRKLQERHPERIYSTLKEGQTAQADERQRPKTARSPLKPPQSQLELT